MPRRFDSFRRNFSCGSVNEIICFVMSTNYTPGITSGIQPGALWTIC
jgi:hypothetical protein